VKAAPTQLELPVTGPGCQRWRDRRHSWRRRSAGGFQADRYYVEPIPEPAAKGFVVRHHYSGTFPVSVRRFGLFDRTGTGGLLGTAVFGVPMTARVLTQVFPALEPVAGSLELSRFVLLDPVPANAESWFLARCFEALAAVDVRGVVAFADPVQRRDAAGRIVCPGHLGIIYQAKSAVYLGRSTARTQILLPDGTTLTARAAQKVRRHEKGYDYVVRRLVAFGARPPRAFEDPARWLPEALEAIGACRFRHPGCHRYAFALGRNARQRAQVTVAGVAGPYPKGPPR
jgi:hypothetical protein